MIRIPNELLQDSSFDIQSYVLDSLLSPSPDRQARLDRYAKHRAELKAAGLLADDGSEIKVTECPAVQYVGEDDVVHCERRRGHKGSHRYVVEW